MQRIAPSIRLIRCQSAATAETEAPTTQKPSATEASSAAATAPTTAGAEEFYEVYLDKPLGIKFGRGAKVTNPYSRLLGQARMVVCVLSSG